MDKYQLMNEIGRICDDRDRWKGIADRVTAERDSAWSRLMELTGTTRVGTVPEAEETIAGRLLRFAKRELRRCLDGREIGDGMTYESFADSVLDTWRVPKELSVEDVKTILKDDIREMYEAYRETWTEQEEDDE